jgi:tRNA (guanine26-N2/guanine27-N2)-dimethyltransferase
MPLKAKYCHEMSLRTLLHAIDSAANKYKRYIVPWVSLSVDFYIRVFVRVFESPLEVKKSSLKRIMVYQSTQCPSFYIHRLGQITGTNKEGNPINYGAVPYQGPSKCEETNGNLKIGGPFWGDPLHSQTVVDELLKNVEHLMNNEKVEEGDIPPPATGKRIIGILTSISEELKDVPFHYCLPDLAACVHIVTPSMTEFKAALHRLTDG